MSKILTQIQDKNGVTTRRWMNAESSARQSRMNRLMGASPAQSLTFSPDAIDKADIDQLTRYIDEAMVKGHLEDLVMNFAQHPKLPALYQSLFIQKHDSSELGDALLENPNVSVGTVEHYYLESLSESNLLAALNHPLLPIDHAIDNYDNDVYEDIIRSGSEWSLRAETQNHRVKLHFGSRS